uniref:Uncharacterized protein n=1 Tax=Equus caballus TaxID=9796 RepID=A0A9L0TIN5_HORSE
MVQRLWKTAWRFLRKLKIELLYDPEISLLARYSKELKGKSWGDRCTSMFIAELFSIAKRWKQPKCPLTDEWINKMWSIHTVEYYSALKKENSNTCYYMDKT